MPAVIEQPRSRAARGVAGVLIASQLALVAAPARAADAPADQIADALVAEAEARGASAGDAEALSRLKLAFASSGRASHGLALARFLARSGRLLDALALYRAVASQSKDSFRGSADAEAAASAKSELGALGPRIPTLRLRPSSGGATRVTVDGREVATNAWLALEPGKHAVDASAPGFASKHVELTLAEGEHTDSALELVSLNPAVAVAPSATVTPGSAPAAAPAAQTAPQFTLSASARRSPPPPRAPDDDAPLVSPRGNSQRMLGYLIIATGAAGLIGGGVTAYLAHQKRQDAKPSCDDTGACTPPNLDDANTLSTLSTVGFAAGGGLAALGLVVVLSAPRAPVSAGNGAQHFSGIYFNGQF